MEARTKQVSVKGVPLSFWRRVRAAAILEGKEVAEWLIEKLTPHLPPAQ